MTKSEIRELSVQDIETMNYSQLVSLVAERNRPSGGIRTVQTIAVNSFLSAHSKVLEIGCNTGFTAVNLALLCSAKIVGIDTNEDSLNQARDYAAAQGIEKFTDFINCNVLDLPFKEASFDMVWASNVTSFIIDKDRAVKEYLRVLKCHGILAFVPIYYRIAPPMKIVTEVGEAIGCAIDVRTRDEWLERIHDCAERSNSCLELIFSEDYEYINQQNRVEDFCSRVLEQPTRKKFSSRQEEALKKRFTEMMKLFNDNLTYCGYSIFLLQKRAVRDQEELFISRRVQS